MMVDVVIGSKMGKGKAEEMGCIRRYAYKYPRGKFALHRSDTPSCVGEIILAVTGQVQ